MSKQSILIAILIAIIVILIAGYIIYQGLNKEEVVQENEITAIFSGLKEYTKIEFSDEKDVEISWMVEKEEAIKEMVVNGKQIEAEKVTNSDIIGKYFQDNGFEKDIYNVASGTVVSLIGYKKDNVICVVVKKMRADGFSPEGDYLGEDVSVKCGYFNKLSEGLSGGEIIDGGTKNIKKNDEFVVSLESNPTTGYQWNVDFDNSYIELVDVSYDLEDSELMGSGSTEVFKFKALQEGEVDLTFSYLRSWEEKAPIKKVSYKIIVK